jgi:hypothetical protein
MLASNETTYRGARNGFNVKEKKEGGGREMTIRTNKRDRKGIRVKIPVNSKDKHACAVRQWLL